MKLREDTSNIANKSKSIARSLLIIPRLIVLSLKSQRFSLPLLALILALQIVCGQTAATALANRSPVLALAVQQLSGDSHSTKFVELLRESSAFTVCQVDPQLSAKDVFNSENVQGLVVVPADFEQRLARMRSPMVVWQTAPGINDSHVAREQVADVVLQLQSLEHLSSALAELGEDSFANVPARVDELIQTVYDGPQFLAAGSNAGQAYGVSALLALLSFLHAAFVLPKLRNRRLLARGQKAWTNTFIAGLTGIWLVWFLLVVLYFVIIWLMGVSFDVLRLLVFILIVVYSSLLGGMLTAIFGATVATWVFVPLFLLNMTLGGGIWGEAVAIPALTAVVPVTAAVIGSGDALASPAFMQSLTMLALGSCLCIAIVAIAARRLPHYSLIPIRFWSKS